MHVCSQILLEQFGAQVAVVSVHCLACRAENTHQSAGEQREREKQKLSTVNMSLLTFTTDMTSTVEIRLFKPSGKIRNER